MDANSVSTTASTCVSTGFAAHYPECACSVAQSCPTLFNPMNFTHQPPLSMGFSRRGYWSGLPFPSLGDLPDLGIEPASPALAGGFFIIEPPGTHPSCYQADVISRLLLSPCWRTSESTRGSAPLCFLPRFPVFILIMPSPAL